jgi:hypothetical protein
MKHIEYALLDIKTAITDHLQTKLTAIQTEMNTLEGFTITLTAPISTAYYIHELAAIDQMPAIQIIADNTNVDIPGGKWNDVEHKIIVVCHVVATEGREDYCAKRAMRFSRAINEIILDHRTIDGSYMNWYATSVDYKPMMTNGNDMKQEVWINTVVKMIENA